MLDQEVEPETNNNSLLWSLGQLPDYDSSGLDYLLALSLQSDGDQEDLGTHQGIWTDVWDHRLGRESAQSTLHSQLTSTTNNNTYFSSAPTNTDTTPAYQPASEIMLPCEFCEELYPEEDLILHQV